MKKCPQCQQTYSDDNDFCHNDGAGLITAESFNTQSSLYSIAQPAPVPTNVVSARQTSPILYAALGGMAILVLVLGGFLLFSRNSSESDEDKAGTANKSEETSSKKTEETNKITSDIPPASSATIEKPAAPNLQTPKPYISPAGNWRGQWTNGKGSAFDQQFTLKDDGNGKISGQIVHTLQSTINMEKTGKIGLTAVEYVEGVYDPNTRIINISGVRKVDPNNLIILDKYRLSLSSDNSILAGETFGGKTRGRITFRR